MAMNGADQLRQGRKDRLAALAARAAGGRRAQTQQTPPAAAATQRRADPSSAQPFNAGDKPDGVTAIPPEVSSDVGKPIGVEMGDQLDPKMGAYARMRAKLRQAEGVDPAALTPNTAPQPTLPPPATKPEGAPVQATPEEMEMARAKCVEEAKAQGMDEVEANRYADEEMKKQFGDMLPPAPAGDPPPPAEGDAVDDAQRAADDETRELEQAMDDALQQTQQQADGAPPEETPPADAGEGVPTEQEQQEKKDAEWMEMMTEGELEAKKAYALHLYLVNADAVDPHYVVLADGHAFGEIHYADQPGEKTAEFKRMFCDAGVYADTFEKSVRKFGLRQTLRQVSGRTYAAKVSKSKLAQQIRAEVQKELESQHREKLAGLKDQFADWFAIALDAFNKGVLTRGEGHPIKEEMVKQLAAAKIHPQRAIEMVEASFRAGGRRFASAVATRALEWMARPKEHQVAIVAEVRGADHHVPVVASDAEIIDGNVRELAMGSVPLTSLGTQAPRGQAERYAALDPEMADLAARGKQTVRSLLGRR